ncbi:MAG: hypothetical protein K2V38_18255 [Gemmataceae bacterium]|nr:hypothetical protein [Gemmataceae bacterium]
MASVITATVRGGRLEVTEPLDLPDGTQLQVLLPDARDEGLMSPEEIASVLAAMDRVEPFDLTADERAAWEAERAARRVREKAAFVEQSEHLRRMWDAPIPPG